MGARSHGAWHAIVIECTEGHGLGFESRASAYVMASSIVTEMAAAPAAPDGKNRLKHILAHDEKFLSLHRVKQHLKACIYPYHSGCSFKNAFIGRYVPTIVCSPSLCYFRLQSSVTMRQLCRLRYSFSPYQLPASVVPEASARWRRSVAGSVGS